MIINDKRELAYVVLIDDIEPIEGADRVETAIVGGWRVMVRKDQFKVGDKAVYFEIDSKVPQTPEFEFLSKKNWKIKTQKYFKGKVISQGLLMSFEDLNLDSSLKVHQPLTEQLGVKYAVDEDNIRKGTDFDSAMQSLKDRRKTLFKKPIIKKLMKYAWGRKLVFFLFGSKRDVSRGFPKGFPYISKTDEERVENMPWVLENKTPMILTEKLDGTSCTYILEKKRFGKYEFYVSSRNVRQLPNTVTYHQQTNQMDKNIYWELAEKYDIENKLKAYLKENKLKYVCIQGEGVGYVQGNPLKLNEDRLYVFNFIRSDKGRLSSTEGKEIIEKMGMNWVPILATDYVLPDSMEEFKLFADGNSVVNPKVMREGLVIREPVSGLSFKNVSRQFLLEHNG